LGKLRELESIIREVLEVSRLEGLDFYPLHFTCCSLETMCSLGAMGAGKRFFHWSFGQDYHRIKLYHSLRLGKIYELVFFSNPCLAFLLESNSPLENKLVVAHVAAHSDFFKNNVSFSSCPQDMLHLMALHADRIKLFEEEFGYHQVEILLDALIALKVCVDPGDPFLEKDVQPPTRDILGFLRRKSPKLEDWQREVLLMGRGEMIYFWPLMETKIINEGWATYWHTRILREMDLSEEESIDFACLQGDILKPLEREVNPYLLGYALFLDYREALGTGEDFRSAGSGKGRLFFVQLSDSRTGGKAGSLYLQEDRPGMDGGGEGR